MDEAAIEAAGIKPIQADLDAVNAIKDQKGLLARSRRTRAPQSQSPIATGVAQDDKDPEQYIAVVAQGGLGLPDRDMYDAKNKQFEAVRVGYKKYIAAMLTQHRREGRRQEAPRRSTRSRRSSRSVHWTRVQNRDPQKTLQQD